MGKYLWLLSTPLCTAFVMLTGMLLLPVKQEIGEFYHKRMLRVIIPFVIWSLLYNLFPWFTGILGLNSSVLSVMFPYAGENPSQSFGSCLHNILMIPFNFNTYTVPLWYIYMFVDRLVSLSALFLCVGEASHKEASKNILVDLGPYFILALLPGVYNFKYRGSLCLE